MIFDVAASATALAAARSQSAQQDRHVQRSRIDPPQQRGLRSLHVHYVFDTFAQANVTGSPR